MNEDSSLRNFIKSVEKLHETIPGSLETGFDVDFLELKRVSLSLKQNCKYETTHGQRLENKKKNRYKDILPFDYSRVTLNCRNNDPNSDYINASIVKGAYGQKNYIASQGPLPHTVVDFWRMLWQYNVSVVVMVCREIEMGKKKCERYWAEKDNPRRFGDIDVSFFEEENFEDGYSMRTLTAQKGNEKRTIKQFHYRSWPDHGVPKTCYELLNFINRVRDLQPYEKDETTPLCVHCSAGCGRTGAVLAVDYVRNLLHDKKVPPDLKMVDIITEMRKQRPAIVQTRDQYEFVNSSVLEMFDTYMRTRSLTYTGFIAGYQQEAYVNINISKPHNGMVEARKDSRSYENIDFMRRQARIKPPPKPTLQKKVSDPDSYPSDPPPAKPSRVASTARPVSVCVVSTTPPNPAHGIFGHASGAKQSPVDGERKLSIPVSSTPLYATLPRLDQTLGNSGKPSTNPPRKPSSPGFSIPGREPGKPAPPRNKPMLKLDHPNKPLSDSNQVVKSPVSPIIPKASQPSPAPPLAKPRMVTLRTIKPGSTSPDPKSPVTAKVNFLNNLEKSNATKSPPKRRPRTRLPVKPLPGNRTDQFKGPKIKTPEADKKLESGKKNPPQVFPKPDISGLIKQHEQNAGVADKQRTVVSTADTEMKLPKSNALSKPFNKSTTPSLAENVPVSVGDKNHGQPNSPNLAPSSKKGVRHRSRERSDKTPNFTANNNNKDLTNTDEPPLDAPENSAGSFSNSSYGLAFFTAKSGHKQMNYSINSPAPFKPGSKLSLPRKTTLQSEEKTDMSLKKPHHASMSSIFSWQDKSHTHSTPLPPATYVNTEFRPYKSDPKQNPTTHTINRSLSSSSENSSVFASSPPPNASNPKERVKEDHINSGAWMDPVQHDNTDNITHLHGSVDTKLNEVGKPPFATKSTVPNTSESKQRTAPAKPRRSRLHKDEKQPADGRNSPKINLDLTTYKKNHHYNDIPPDGSNSPRTLPDSDYAAGEEVSEKWPPTGTAKPQVPPGKPSGPPKLPTRTAESMMLLDDSPPMLPSRTPESYLIITESDDSDHDKYEQVDHSSVDSDKRLTTDVEQRRSSHSSTPNTHFFAAKAKGVFEKTTSAFSKVGASIAKSMEDDSPSAKPVSVNDRVPTYVPGPTYYGGQDMSFGKKLVRKVKGARNLH